MAKFQKILVVQKKARIVVKKSTLTKKKIEKLLKDNNILSECKIDLVRLNVSGKKLLLTFY